MTKNGTNSTGFMPGENGPFRCDHCVYWRSPMGCVESKVVADPEVPKIKSSNGEVLARAQADDCCKWFEPRRPRVSEVKFDEVGL